MMNGTTRFLWVFLLSLMAHLAAPAQKYQIRPLGLEQGLSCNYVVSMAQDKHGFLWIATEEGLNRFDGNRFFNYYKRRDRQGISSSELNCVIDDAKAPVVWIGTKNDGLNSFNYQTEEWQCYKHDAKDAASIATNDITKITQSEDGKLWISTYWAGVEQLDPATGKFAHFGKKQVKGLPDNQLWCVLDLGNGILLAGHVKSGLSFIDTRHLVARNFQHSDHDAFSVSSNEVNSLYRDKRGTIWIGTSRGIDIFDPLSQRFLHVSDQIFGSHRIFDFCELPDGKMLVATEQMGIAVLDVNRKLFEASTQVPCSFINQGIGDYNLSGNSIRCMLLDKYNNVWAGLYGGGINFLTQFYPPFRTIRVGTPDQVERLTDRSVMGLTIDRNRQLWVGTDGGGLNVISAERTRVDVYPMEAGTTVQAAVTDSRGNLWFGAFCQGATVRMAQGGFRRVLPDSHEDVRCFYEDDRHQMWVGTARGIYVVDIDQMKVVKSYHLGNDLVRAITMDAQHHVWVGYFGYGIEVYSPQMKLQKLFSISKKDGEYIPSNSVNHLICDSKNRIWAATNEGAVCFDGKKMSRIAIYDQQQGMSNVHVRAIVEDLNRNIWMSTNRGISCLKANQPHRILNFDEKDNVVQANFNDASVVRTRKGAICFGSAQGLCYFQPERLLAVTRAPKPIITSLTLIRGMEQADSIINLTLRNQVSLAYDENTFAINFTVPNFGLERFAEYSYMLSGLQKDWITVQQGSIMLRDIPAGTYQLQVRARFHNQPWSSGVAKFTIVVRPPFWLSWWAKLFYTLVALAFGYLALRVYQRNLALKYQLRAEKVNHEKEQKLNEERLRFFTNITHELRTPLTLILGPLDDISHSSDISKAVKHKLAVIHQSVVRLNDLITQILEFRKAETDNRQLRVQKANVVDAVHEISLKYEELAQKPDVTIRFVAPEKQIEMYIDKEVIAIIVDNLISNAIKYTDQGNIDVCVERRRSGERHLVDISVSDTGHGISAKALPHIFDRYYQENGAHQASGTGIGLSLVKKLVTLHHGEVKAESNLEQGTSIIVTLDENEIYPEALRGDEAANAKLTGAETARTGALDASGISDASDDFNSEENALGENRKPQLLVVEDNREILNYVADSFADEFEILKAKDGREGLALALDKVPDVIISDVMMPNMSGNAMCKTLKHDVRTSHIPIILLTAKDSLEAKEKGYESGADSYITKPFTHSLLRSRIQNLLLQRRRDKLQIQESKETDLSQKKEQLRESLSKVDQEFFDKLNKLIAENISGDVDVNLVASSLAVSTSTLYRKMKALTGISTNEYIRKYKMQYAEHLLLEGKYSISEISFMVGMSSVAYFRRCFKAEYGEIPSEYLKKLKQM